MEILVRQPDTAYRADMLWLPKEKVNPHAVRAYCSMYKGGTDLLEAYWESLRHIVVPRQTPLPRHRDFEVIPYGPTQWEHVGWSCTAESRDDSDRSAWAALSVANNGVLHLGCGKGKTVLGLRRIALDQYPSASPPPRPSA